MFEHDDGPLCPKYTHTASVERRCVRIRAICSPAITRCAPPPSRYFARAAPRVATGEVAGGDGRRLLTIDQVVELHARALYQFGGEAGLRSAELLASPVLTSQQSAFGTRRARGFPRMPLPTR